MLNNQVAQLMQAVPRHSIDYSDIPNWGKASDGSYVKIEGDVEMQVSFEAWLAEACQHTGQFTGKTHNSLGVEVFKRYCKQCGVATTQQLPHRTIEGTAVTLIDDDKRQKLIDKYVRYRRDGFEEIKTAAADRLQPDRSGQYSEYLTSPEWKARRSAVMERCDGICEGCRERSAEDVHHLTYKHIGAEFLFELVGLCRPCHIRWHSEDQ